MLKDREILDHLQNAKHPKFHRFLHLIKETREQMGADSFDYEQVVLKLARFLADISDWNEASWPPEELFHYFEGHHKPDIDKATDFLVKYLKMNDKEDRNSTQIINDTLNYTNPSKPGMADGFSETSNNEWNEGPMNIHYDFASYANRPDSTIFLENRPWGNDPEMIERLRKNEYFNMILNRKEQK
jgi:hypothetical protein